MQENQIHLTSNPQALVTAAVLAVIWLLFTVWKLRSARPQAVSGAADHLVIEASQTGHAADLAEQARLRIEGTGQSCLHVEANRVSADMLEQAHTVLFVVSTTGDGQAPDNAHRFERGLLAQSPDLSGKSVAILALGDRRYTDFCGFGHRIEAWARACGAEFLFPLIEVDDLAPGDLAAWSAHLSEQGFTPVGETAPASGEHWKVSARDQVAGPSRSAAGELTSDGLYRIALNQQAGSVPDWEVGDLFELTTPDGHLRDYSIASAPGEAAVQLFVRRVVEQGVVGRGSGLLTDADLGSAAITGRIRSHRSFRPPTGDGPVLAIASGSGWAGVRPHLLHAMSLGQPCQLIFGERASQSEAAVLSEMRLWQDEGRLANLHLALSQGGQQAGPYVQHVLSEKRAEIAEFLGSGGRVVLCGRLAMGERIIAVLSEVMGAEWIDAAIEEGRLRRDLY